MPPQFHMPLTADDRQTAVELQAMLVDVVDLTLMAKQAHWNVVGPHFRSVHLQLDELADAWRAMADDVAERAVTLGAAPDGQAEIVAGSTHLEPLPAGHLLDDEVIDAIAERVADVAKRTLERIDAVAEDVVTQDLLIRIAETLDKQRWMLQAQRPAH
jgi:starvation-inducible DNA-binding protein